MQIRSILEPQAVLGASKASNKKRLFKEIAQHASTLLGVECQVLLSALQEREDLGPTGMGDGIAIPHARIEGIDKVHGVFIRLQDAIEFDANDNQPVDLIFALFAPIDAGVEHLKALARVSRILRDEDIRKNLRSTSDSEALFAILAETIDSVAA